MFDTESSSGKASAPSPRRQGAGDQAPGIRHRRSDRDAGVRAATTAPCPMSTPASAAQSPTANEKS